MIFYSILLLTEEQELLQEGKGNLYCQTQSPKQ